MTWRENIERVRKALPTRADEHHNLCNTRHKKPCDCYAQQTVPAHAALDALTAQMEELEAALREIRVACDPVVHGGSFNENGARRRLTDIEALAHVALVGELLRSQSDPPASG